MNNTRAEDADSVTPKQSTTGLGFRELGFRNSGFRDLVFRDLGFRDLGFRDWA